MQVTKAAVINLDNDGVVIVRIRDGVYQSRDAQRLIASQEMERQRIARELHDDIRRPGPRQHAGACGSPEGTTDD
jgi:signal transduction histidine kinase